MSSNAINSSLLTLQCEKSGKCYDLLKKETNVVGRFGFDGDLEIPDDLSVSRFHAVISVTKKVVNNFVEINIEVIDKNSKFGTFINEGIDNNVSIKSGIPKVLKLHDKIRFGRIDSIWVVKEFQVIVCPSTLTKPDKDNLKKLMTKLGGIMVREWSDECVHLCMNSITITEKALLCLASAKPIVTLQYYFDLYKALLPNSMITLPFCDGYIPPLKEALLNTEFISFNVINKRKRLFGGLTFICSTKEQLVRIEKMVKYAGGEAIHFLDCNISIEEILNSSSYILMQQDPFNMKDVDKYSTIIKNLEVKNKRLIPENDIGLSIINVNTKKHCNPSHKFTLVNLQSQASNLDTPIDLVPETEVVFFNESKTCSVNIIQDSQVSQQRFKRPCEEYSDSEEIIFSRKRTPINEEVNIKHEIKGEIQDENFEEEFKIEITDNIDSLKNENVEPDLLKNSYSLSTELKNLSTIENSCIATIQPSQEQLIETKTNMFNSNCTDVAKSVIHQYSLASNRTKRKIHDTRTIFNDNYDEDDLFDYKDIDEIEGPPPKKKTQNSLLQSFFCLPESSVKKEVVSSEKTDVKSIIDPDYIMKNLLADVKDDAQFIDTSNLICNQSSCNELNQSENKDLINSVITETRCMVVSKSANKLTNSTSFQNGCSLPNFKKFKKVGPTIRIPYIVPLTFSQFDSE
ncbi:nibrin [Daktulosphaira vitifoliae]|uniref:nibrin n=1 Tax=Daktulosphaira vitifoliae TaxID=58002 RepID=UPI0021A9851F|nr:nibrin [Daktulosphaira vitifoliae]